MNKKKRETAGLLKQIRHDDFIILLDEHGKQFSSPELAELINQPYRGRIVLIIGGAYGTDNSLKERANMIWSISKLVFPHQLMRLIVTEQLYRAFTINRGEKYHHN